MNEMTVEELRAVLDNVPDNFKITIYNTHFECIKEVTEQSIVINEEEQRVSFIN